MWTTSSLDHPATQPVSPQRSTLVGALSVLSCIAMLSATPAAQAQHHGWGGPEFGRQVRVLPRAEWIPYHGARYAYRDGYWYVPRGGAYLTVRPPYGIVVGALPALATAITIAGVTYWYANDIYYRAAPDGYEVVAPPTAAPPTRSATSERPPERVFVYPRQGQNPERQASDEYACHQWAVNQSGFDPSAQATGNGPTDAAGRQDYQRAQNACLDGRGYTVR